jgi:hypothetical protein
LFVIDEVVLLKELLLMEFEFPRHRGDLMRNLPISLGVKIVIFSRMIDDCTLG